MNNLLTLFGALVLLSLPLSAQGEHQADDLLTSSRGVVDYEYHSATATGMWDINGDGFPEYAVGSPGAYANAGALFITSGVDGSTLLSFSGAAADDYFGSSVASPGDLDGDGYGDILVGAYGYDSFRGRVYLLSGFDGSTIATIDGANQGDMFGYSCDSLGDIDGDLVGDFIVGAYSFSTDAGQAEVFSGASQANLFTFTGAFGDYLGYAVSAAGDVDGDGTPDLMVSRHGDNSFTGAVDVYSGATGVAIYNFLGSAAGDSFGMAIDAAGDLNADGFDDLIVGAYGAMAYAGEVHIISGADGSDLFLLTGIYSYDYFGSAVAGIGDADGDGVGDVLIGSPGWDWELGAAWVISGADGSTLSWIPGAEYGDSYGYSVAGIGDIDGEGHADFLIGSPYVDGPNGEIDAGVADIWSLWTKYMTPTGWYMSISTGGLLLYELDFGKDYSASFYQILISGSGVGPTNLNGLSVPLTADGMFNNCLAGNYPSQAYNFIGPLNWWGRGMAAVYVPSALPSSLLGATYYFAAVVGDWGGNFTASSFATSMTFTY